MTAGLVSGVLLVDKPAGPTSHDIVARARRSLGVRRIGHTGTLDPFASGLLLLCVGPSTRLAEYLTVLDKVYVATAVLGQTTDTDDLEGEVLRVSEAWRPLEAGRIEEALHGFVGEILQLPPRFSAKKVEGERTYKKARRGEAVHLEPVPVLIHEAELLETDLPRVRFRVCCSSGTYVRALARDLGETLGTGAHLVELRRTRVGPFEVERAVPGDQLNDPAKVRNAWLSPAEAVAHLPTVSVGEQDARLIAHGQAIPVGEPDLPELGPVAVIHDRSLVAVATRSGDRLRPRKVFAVG